MTDIPAHGPNVSKLILRFVAVEAVPAGVGRDTGFSNVIEFIRTPEYRKKILDAAEAKAMASLQAIKSAPDNPYGQDDEKIAEALLQTIVKRESKSH